MVELGHQERSRMSLIDQLQEDMKTAMRAKDMDRLGVIRFLLAEIKNVEIDAGKLDDAGIQKIIQRQIKQINEALADYQRAARADLIKQEEGKIAVLEKYLPEQLSDEQLRDTVSSVMAQHPDLDQGPLIGKVLQQVRGQADGKRVGQIVQALLAQK